MHTCKLGKDVLNIIKGSGIGPASYVSYLHPVTTGNSMHKYANDTYLVVPAASVQSCASEIANVELWADVNNLKLNRTKSQEIAEEQMCPEGAATCSCRLRVDQGTRQSA